MKTNPLFTAAGAENSNDTASLPAFAHSVNDPFQHWPHTNRCRRVSEIVAIVLAFLATLPTRKRGTV